jgi:hypothetical protein
MQRYERVNAEKIGVLLHQPFADFNANNHPFEGRYLETAFSRIAFVIGGVDGEN